MLITVNCLECDSAVESDSTRFGSDIPCPHCGSTVKIPKSYVGRGVTIGGFEIQDQIGKGGMGEVFLARQINMQRDIALKVLPKRMTKDKEAVTRFLHEARVAAKLEHPNVVTIIDAGEDEGHYYIAMRFVKGQTLEQILKKHRPLPEKDALAYIQKVLIALDFGWRHHRILHRDIKPANIMIDSYGEVKLLDMGLAKGLLEESGITLTGTILGTPYFMSPEQARSIRELDFHSDMYSAGATLFYLLTGRPPFNAESAVTVMTQHLEEPPPDVRSLNPSVSANTAELVNRMLAKDPEDRYASYDDVIQVIAEILDDEAPTISSPAPTLTPSIDTTDTVYTADADSSGGGSNKVAFLVTAAMVFISLSLLVAIIMIKTSSGRQKAPKVVDADSGVGKVDDPLSTGDPTGGREEGRTKRQLTFLRSLPTQTPEQLIAARKRCQGLLNEYKGTEYEDDFQRLWNKLDASYSAMCQKEWNRLNAAASKAFNVGQAEAALAILETYTGPLEKGTAKRRDALARQFRDSILKKKQAELAKERAIELAKERQQARLRKTFEDSLAKTRIDVAKALMVQDFEQALMEYSKLYSNTNFSSFGEEISETFSGLAELCEVNGLGLEAVRKLKGKTVTLNLKGAAKPLTAEISGIEGNMILASEPATFGRVSHRIPLRQLTPSDRFKLFAAVKPEVKEVIKSLLLLEMKDVAKARAVLDKSSLPIAEVILLTLGLELKPSWQKLLKTAKLPVDGYEIDDLRKMFDNRIYDDDEKQDIKVDAHRFIKFFASNPSAKKHVALAKHMDEVLHNFILPDGLRPVRTQPVSLKPFPANVRQCLAFQKKYAAENGLPVEAVNLTGISFRLIPTGASWNFLSNPPKNPYYLSTHEVTAATWKKVMGNYRFPVREGMPVEGITMTDAVEFLDKLCKLEKLPRGSYRLPTSSEWIYACKAGTKSRFYFGDNANELHRFANYLDKTGPNSYLGKAVDRFKDLKHSDGHSRTSPVGSYPCNPWGLYDMLGNVSEYVADGELAFAIKRGSVKGGSWLLGKRDCDVKADHKVGLQMQKFGSTPSPIPVGFRIVRVIRKKN